MSTKAPSPEDIAIGTRIRHARRRAGLSQSRLAQALGVTFQQVQKYEKGTNRIASGRLGTAAAVLHTTIGELLGPEAATSSAGLSAEALRFAEVFDRLPEGPERQALRWALDAAIAQAA